MVQVPIGQLNASHIVSLSSAIIPIKSAYVYGQTAKH